MYYRLALLAPGSYKVVRFHHAVKNRIWYLYFRRSPCMAVLISNTPCSELLTDSPTSPSNTRRVRAKCQVFSDGTGRWHVEPTHPPINIYIYIRISQFLLDSSKQQLTRTCLYCSYSLNGLVARNGFTVRMSDRWTWMFVFGGTWLACKRS